jgi:hypothetical protein
MDVALTVALTLDDIKSSGMIHLTYVYFKVISWRKIL